MTLLLPKKNETPVFDLPAFNSCGKGFVARRFTGLPGRPILAEKNLPIAPSSSFRNRKCFSPMLNILYKANDFMGIEPVFCPATDSLKPTPDDFTGHFDPVFAKHKPTMPDIHFSINVNTAKPVEKIANNAIKKNEKPLQFETGNIFSCPEDFLCKSYSIAGIKDQQKLPAVFTSLFVIQASDNSINEKSLYAKNRSKCTSFRLQSFELQTSRICDASLKLNFKQLVWRESLVKVLFGCCKTQAEVSYNGLLRIQRQNFSPIGTVPDNQVSGFSTREFIKNLFLELKTSLRLQTSIKSNAKSGSFFISCKISDFAKTFKQSSPFFSPNCFTDPIKSDNQSATMPAGIFKTPTNNVLADKWLTKCFYFNTCPTSGKTFFKFKLRLSRQKLSEKSYQFSHILPFYFPQTIFTAKRPIKNEFNKIAISEKPVLFKSINVLTDLHSHPIGFKQIRSTMKMQANRHRKYCLNILKRPLACSLERNYRIKFSDSQYLCSSDRSVKTEKITISLFNPDLIQSILARPLSLLMSITDMHFTDISLPSNRRQAIQKPGQFLLNPVGKPVKKRRTTLRTLRFKLEAAENSSYIQTRLKPSRRILPNRPNMYLELNPDTYLNSQDIFFINQSFKKAAPTHFYRGRLEKLSFSDPVPAEITATLNFFFAIEGINIPSFLPQKHFIVPSTGQISIKHYHCRMRLSPYPFGFPAFLPEKIILKPLIKRCGLSHKFEPGKSQGAKTDFIFNNLPPRHARLSMKNPRHWLFSDIYSSDLCGNFFKTMPTIACARLYQPEDKRNFGHHWEIPNHAVSASTILMYFGSERSISRKYSCRTVSLQDNPVFAIKKHFMKSVITMPSIRKILLRIRKIKIDKHSPGDFRGQITLFSRHKKFDIPALLKTFIKQSCKISSLELFKCFPKTFKHPFFSSSDKKCRRAQSVYKARFRGLRFPYRPDLSTVQTVNGSFKDYLETHQTMENSNIDFSRVSELSLNSERPLYYNHYHTGFSLRPVVVSDNTFTFDSDFFRRESLLIRCERDFSLPATPKTRFCEYYDSQKFLSPYFKSVFRLKKVYRLDQHSFSYLAENFLFDRYTMKNRNHDENIIRRNFSQTSPHLVILFINRKPTEKNFIHQVFDKTCRTYSYSCYSTAKAEINQSCFTETEPLIIYSNPDKPNFKQSIKEFSLPDEPIFQHKRFKTLARNYVPGNSISSKKISKTQYLKKQTEILKPDFRAIRMFSYSEIKDRDTALQKTYCTDFAIDYHIDSRSEVNPKLFRDAACRYRDLFLPEWQEMAFKKEDLLLSSISQ